ncbi:MAG: undecaprenyl-diphosphate phosphatase [Chitinophagaceae bacterium]|nr:undecaprenyl-diphosphate phosphatase [Chitinophagaceae bacterium]
MNIFQSIIIAIIEGITEFLPISSTAHMKFANPFLGIESTPFVDLFEIVIQLAAIASVVVIYRKRFFDFKHYSFYIKLIIAVIPALIFGAALKKHIDAALGNLWVIAIVMVAGGVLLLFIDKFFAKAEASKNQASDQKSDQEEVTYKKSFIIGCFQVLSILFPGLSRSAATIIGGMSQQLNKKTALEFSFFLAVPTMLAASAKSTLDVYKTNPEVFGQENLITLLIGAVVAFVVALLSVQFFMRIVEKRGFAPFGWYRIILGLSILGLLYTNYLC